jgi:hypothetical protein
MVRMTEAAGIVPHLGQEEAERRGQHYIGPEHLLVGLLRLGDNPAARLLRHRGLDLAAVRAEVDRLVANGVLPSRQASDAELLAILGINLQAVYGRLKEVFGSEAYYNAAQRVRRRRAHAVLHVPRGGTPLTCRRALVFASEEAIARGQEVNPLHLLLGLLRDAQDPVDTDLYPQERRLRLALGLSNDSAHPIKLVVEARGLSLDELRRAVVSQLDDHSDRSAEQEDTS